MLKASEIPPEKLAEYARGMQRRAEASREALERRRLRTQEVARRAAALLKEKFGARRVVLFGSLAREPKIFYERSDIDLAVWGLDESLYFRALQRLRELDPEIEVDLVEFEFARPGIRRAIEREGKEL
ncbi:MAG: nucleotidyltransferase domain-containing protein [Anaerolineales bacterium]|nr:nucleotidyltransferase domain-containing protein [Anaerolineales bacterium]